eukprot:NODE_1260_length_932_cov_6.168944_g1214_i0.p1 GENE.NODE_1260_length_932_cov_6.168944_g1214_i0~~NODE_1260_length_932_cov_6.168944_g1214_i0.p1  ORF type:complete len:254 (+),score=25.41 NODE_1260_length_932_cov_6.168944_g1214_i0:134-895(+)
MTPVRSDVPLPISARGEREEFLYSARETTPLQWTSRSPTHAASTDMVEALVSINESPGVDLTPTIRREVKHGPPLAALIVIPLVLVVLVLGFLCLLIYVLLFVPPQITVDDLQLDGITSDDGLRLLFKWRVHNPNNQHLLVEHAFTTVAFIDPNTNQTLEIAKPVIHDRIREKAQASKTTFFTLSAFVSGSSQRKRVVSLIRRGCIALHLNSIVGYSYGCGLSATALLHKDQEYTPLCGSSVVVGSGPQSQGT